MISFDLLADIALTRIQNPTAKVILLSLARYSNANGECFPSRERISQDACVPVRSVVRAIYWLEEHGYIRVESRSGSSNFYVITAMEEEMPNDTRANLAHEGDSNITKIDFSKKNISTSRANLAHPNDTPFFLAFWHAYPRHVGKGAARSAFIKAMKICDGDTIIQAAIKYAKHCDEMGTDRQFIPHPATWLNAERWEDDLESENRQSKSGWGAALNDL